MASRRPPSCLAWLFWCALWLPACAHDPRTFRLRAPVLRDQDLDAIRVACSSNGGQRGVQTTACAPEPYESSFSWDAADNSIFRPMSKFFQVDSYGEAENVNAFDEVPDSSWFTNRIGARRLSRDEVARVARFGTEPLRRRWIVGRSTLRLLLGEILGIGPSAVALARGRRGRPELAEASLDFNMSHTCGMALIGIAEALPAGMRIGVDVEHAQRKVNADGLSRKFLTDRERAELAPLPADERRRGFLRLWTCKEAMSKATGDALAAPFRRLDVSQDGGLTLVAGPPPYVPADWALRPVAMPDEFLATVAIWRSGAHAGPMSS